MARIVGVVPELLIACNECFLRGPSATVAPSQEVAYAELCEHDTEVALECFLPSFAILEPLIYAAYLFIQIVSFLNKPLHCSRCPADTHNRPGPGERHSLGLTFSQS